MFNTDGLRAELQRFGGALSWMVMPNIGAFIVWGLITALFIPTGWLPNEKAAVIVEPMLRYLLPLMIGYTGGENIYGKRGGVIGAAATMGVVVGADIAMFLGAMIMGPFAAVCLRKLDSKIKNYIPLGFEMIVNNFSLGILGLFLVLLGLFTVGPVISMASAFLSGGVDFMIKNDLIPLVSLFIEPGKILFLNNAINHGILSPIGVTQTEQYGKSILFLLEPNPGPGLGVLLAYSFFGKGMAKSTAPGVAIIQTLGGIHEPYFPYILMKPVMLLAVIFGEMAGDFIFMTTDAGLVATASPGSVFSILAVTPKMYVVPVLSGMTLSAAISFAIGSMILKFSKEEDSEEYVSAVAMKNSMRFVSPETDDSGESGKIFSVNRQINLGTRKIRRIYFACDAGMGSSIMGASVLRKKLSAAKLAIPVDNTSISKLAKIASDADVIVTHEAMTKLAAEQKPHCVHISIDNFANAARFDEIVEALMDNATRTAKMDSVDFDAEEVTSPEKSSAHITADLLRKKNIFLNQPSKPKEEVIREIGRIMEDSGYTTANYTTAMLKKEELFNTAIGNKLAIPHGVAAMRKEILSSGIVILTYPDGVDWGNGQMVNLVVGIASSGEEHIRILRQLATLLDTSETVDKVLAMNVDEIYKMFS